MSFEFHWEQLDCPELRNTILNKLNQLIQEKLPKSPNITQSTVAEIDYSTFPLDFNTLNPTILSIHFGSITPKLILTNLSLNSAHFRTGEISLQFEYNNKNNENLQCAYIEIAVNAQGNTISAKNLLNKLKLDEMNILDSDKEAYIPIKLSLTQITLLGNITIKTKFNESPLKQLNFEQDSENKESGIATIILHNNPLKSFEIETNLDGCVAGVALRNTLYSKLSAAILKAVNEPIIIPLPKLPPIPK